MSDQLLREGNPPSGFLASPKPQYKNPATNAWEEVLGASGAPRAILYDANGQPLATSINPAYTKDEALKAELEAVKAELQALKANQLSGDQKVQLNGNLNELFGKSLSDRPAASSVRIGTTFMIVGSKTVYQSDGTDWVVI